LAPDHRERATAGRHVHAADLSAFLSQVRSRHIVLHHFSSRYAAEQVPGLLARYLPNSLLQRVRLFLPSGRLAGRG
jgi:ribonuclease BN (tRNA processing enzyme)